MLTMEFKIEGAARSQVAWKHASCTTLAFSINLDGELSPAPEEEYLINDGESDPEETSSRLLMKHELKTLLLDPERSKLTRKLSEANQHNRFLKRQLQVKEDALVDLMNELAVLELELQALVGLAEEVANSGIQLGSRKINGKYIQSHLLTRLEGVHERIKKQIKDVADVKSVEVPVVWVGMAETVQVMGSFDGWTRGEEMSAEYDGVYAKFSTTLSLRPGRYQIKFMVDGEWQLSPEYPTVGEGLTKNNLLVVE
ncbi:hypothetical protein QJS10_CPA01g01515 [Acorus calamus]|uniref:AMP-activated protein kinase glycogen-binding domain-containing protein n=1 Tax=Acorus calamus TaxID=4465 RepID=A0AAV9FG87_ACOCL|nr:hypothetical protein QJS10_CPA01g01515 [Acorus calamus]